MLSHHIMAGCSTLCLNFAHRVRGFIKGYLNLKLNLLNLLILTECVQIRTEVIIMTGVALFPNLWEIARKKWYINELQSAQFKLAVICLGCLGCYCTSSCKHFVGSR